MIYARLEDPPEDIQAEAQTLHEEYMAQFGEGDEFPENVDPATGFRQFILEHGSEKYKKYLLKIERIRKEAERLGIRL